MDLIHHNHELANLIFGEYYKFEPIINEALTQFMVEFDKNCNHHDNKKDDDGKENY